MKRRMGDEATARIGRRAKGTEIAAIVQSDAQSQCSMLAQTNIFVNNKNAEKGTGENEEKELRRPIEL